MASSSSSSSGSMNTPSPSPPPQNMGQGTSQDGERQGTSQGGERQGTATTSVSGLVGTLKMDTAKPSFVVGDRVAVVGTSRADLNGLCGTISEFDAAKKRFAVILDSGKIVSLKRGSLESTGETASRAGSSFNSPVTSSLRAPYSGALSSGEGGRGKQRGEEDEAYMSTLKEFQRSLLLHPPGTTEREHVLLDQLVATQALAERHRRARRADEDTHGHTQQLLGDALARASVGLAAGGGREEKMGGKVKDGDEEEDMSSWKAFHK